MRAWILAAMTVVWLLPSGAQAAAGSNPGPSAQWNDMQKFEFYIGQISGILSICNYHGLAGQLRELANLSPYGKKGLASIGSYDAVKGGYCGKLAADGEAINADRDQLLAYLSEKYACPGGTCAPDDGDTSLTAVCRAEADEHLMSLPVGTDDIKSVHMIIRDAAATSDSGNTGNTGAEGNQRGVAQAGHEARVRLKSCSGWLIIQLTKGCTPQQSFTRGDCSIEGIKGY